MIFINLSRYFLQTKTNGLGEMIIAKCTGAVALLLLEIDRERWKKDLCRENSK